MLLVKKRLARLVPGWVTQGSCGGAVIGWVQVYYNQLDKKNMSPSRSGNSGIVVIGWLVVLGLTAL